MLLYYLSFLSKDASIAFVFSFLLYVLGSVTNPLHQLLAIPSVCCYQCPPFFENNDAFYINFEFCLKKGLFQNISKIISKYSKNIF